MAAAQPVAAEPAAAPQITPILTKPRDLTIFAARSTIMAISGDVAAVVIGDPSIADVSMQQNLLVLQGKSFGTTDVTILDRDNNQIAAWLVHVARPKEATVDVYRSTARSSYSCLPACETLAAVSAASIPAAPGAGAPPAPRAAVAPQQ